MSLLEFQQVGYWYKDKSQPLFQDINISFQKENSTPLLAHQGQGKPLSCLWQADLTHQKKETSFTTEKRFLKSA